MARATKVFLARNNGREREEKGTGGLLTGPLCRRGRGDRDARALDQDSRR